MGMIVSYLIKVGDGCSLLVSGRRKGIKSSGLSMHQFSFIRHGVFGLDT